MKANIFIHFKGQIVEKFELEFDEIKELQNLLDYARNKYKDESFCFDVMI